jgi:ribonuclease R
LAENGAEGLVPVSSLPGDYYERDVKRQRLIGRRSRRVFRIGDEVSVRLVEADGIGGRIVFHIQEDGTTMRSAERSRSPARRGPRRGR